MANQSPPGQTVIPPSQLELHADPSRIDEQRKKHAKTPQALPHSAAETALPAQDFGVVQGSDQKSRKKEDRRREREDRHKGVHGSHHSSQAHYSQHSRRPHHEPIVEVNREVGGKVQKEVVHYTQADAKGRDERDESGSDGSLQSRSRSSSVEYVTESSASEPEPEPQPPRPTRKEKPKVYKREQYQAPSVRQPSQQPSSHPSHASVPQYYPPSSVARQVVPSKSKKDKKEKTVKSKTVPPQLLPQSQGQEPEEPIEVDDLIDKWRAEFQHTSDSNKDYVFLRLQKLGFQDRELDVLQQFFNRKSKYAKHYKP